MCIQLEQLLLNKFRRSWEFILPSVLVFQHRVPGILGPIIGVKDGGKEGIKYLCFVYVPICEVAYPVNQQTSVLSDSLFAVNLF